MKTTAICIASMLAVVLTTATGAEPQVSPAKENTLGMKFARIPAGEFLRGFDADNQRDHEFHLAHPYSNRQELGKSERPAHRVAITRPFDMAVSEVTVGQFKAFVDATDHVTEAEKSGGALGCFPEEKDYVDRFHKDPKITWKSPGFAQTDNHPVVAVSWGDAQAFCRWLSNKENASYRLPSEAEWEYACRGGTTTWYSWGKDPDAAYAHANVADGALEAAQPNTTRYQRAVKLGPGDGDGFVFTAPTAHFKPNGWGLYDMHGNVWEWCQDRWSADVYERLFDGIPRHKRNELLVRDPLFEKETEQHKFGDWRVIRGGAWTCAPASVRCPIRAYAEAADASVYTGFRVVRR